MTQGELTQYSFVDPEFAPSGPGGYERVFTSTKRSNKKFPEVTSNGGTVTESNDGNTKTYTFSGGTAGKRSWFGRTADADPGTKFDATVIVSDLTPHTPTYGVALNPTPVTSVTVRNQSSSPITINPGTTRSMPSAGSYWNCDTRVATAYVLNGQIQYGYVEGGGGSSGGGGSVTVNAVDIPIFEQVAIKPASMTEAVLNKEETYKIPVQYKKMVSGDAKAETKTFLVKQD